MSDQIIVIGFDDPHTSFLARAALARLQKELGLPSHDLATINRGKEGEVDVHQSTNIGGGMDGRAAFWKALADLLFTPGLSAGTASDASSAIVAEIGIDRAFTSRAAEQLRSSKSALLVLVRGVAMREQLLGVLHGFQGEIMRTPLTRIPPVSRDPFISGNGGDQESRSKKPA
jgi:uncharacterized membrane protein